MSEDKQKEVLDLKTVLSINVSNYGSTGNIMRGISKIAEQNGFLCWQMYAPDKKNATRAERDIISSPYNVRRFNEVYSRITGMRGFQAYFSTLAFLKKVDRIKPDIIHLHNLHNNYIHVGLLFEHIKKHHIKVVWTLHDCWAFTGRCPYFQMSGCERWKVGCHDCPYPKDEYPSVKVDKSYLLWKRKKEAFTGVKDMTVVTPSKWLAGLVMDSFLAEYPVKVINNGIDLSVFKPIESDFRVRYHLKEKRIVLGIAFNWEKRKGLDVFIRLSSVLSDQYQIILVGTNDGVDELLPKSIISIHQTANQKELAEIYSAADVLVNPTREDNFPTVNIESLACGTPVVTFRTGGSAEIIDNSSGISVEQDDIDGLVKAIQDICEGQAIHSEDCLARSKCFDRYEKFKEYVDLYQAI